MIDWDENGEGPVVMSQSEVEVSIGILTIGYETPPVVFCESCEEDKPREECDFVTSYDGEPHWICKVCRERDQA